MNDAPLTNEGATPGRPVPTARGRRLRVRLSAGHIVMIAAGLAAFLLNLLILRGGDETVPAAAAARPLPAGARLAEEDLEQVRVAAGGPLARRLLRVNLSDLAAMGATPDAYFLNLILPNDVDGSWLEGFAGGLRKNARPRPSRRW